MTAPRDVCYRCDSREVIGWCSPHQVLFCAEHRHREVCDQTFTDALAAARAEGTAAERERWQRGIRATFERHGTIGVGDFTAPSPAAAPSGTAEWTYAYERDMTSGETREVQSAPTPAATEDGGRCAFVGCNQSSTNHCESVGCKFRHKPHAEGHPFTPDPTR